jgi:hypothetical protein
VTLSSRASAPLVTLWLLCLGIPVSAGTAPGTLITLTADVSINGVQIDTCSANVVCVNTLFDGRVFFYDRARPWREIFAGAHVRFLQYTSPAAREPEVFEGWTLQNGDVLTPHGIVKR